MDALINYPKILETKRIPLAKSGSTGSTVTITFENNHLYILSVNLGNQNLQGIYMGIGHGATASRNFIQSFTAQSNVGFTVEALSDEYGIRVTNNNTTYSGFIDVIATCPITIS